MEVLLQWYNLVFILPLGLAILYLLVMSIGMLPFGMDSDLDLDFDADVDLDVDVDLDLDFDADVDADVDVDAGSALKALSILGIGKVPLSITIVSMLLLWGVIGWTSNSFLEEFIQTSTAYASISLAAAFIGSILLTSLISKGLVKILPSTETYASSREDLIGRVGTAISSVDSRFGRVRVLDAHRSMIDVTCVVDSEEIPIPEGSKVLLYEYNPEKRKYLGQVFTENDINKRLE